MCNDFGNHIPYSDYLAAFSQTLIPVKWPNAAPNLEPRKDIWPTDNAPILSGNLQASLDGRKLEFACIKRIQGVRDENGQPLGHLRCDFVFEAPSIEMAAATGVVPTRIELAIILFV